MKLRTQELPVLLTPTRVELGQRCWRRHALNDILCLQLWKSPSALFGNVMHTGARAWWESQSAAVTMQAVQMDYASRLPEGHKTMTIQLATAMMEEYMKSARPAGLMQGDWKLVEIEKRFEISLGGFRVSAQMDRVLTKGWELNQIDTKTASRIDKRWFDAWPMSIQQKLYAHVIKEVYGDYPTYLQIEGLEKKPGKPPVYVQVPVVPSLVEEAVAQFVQVAEKDQAALQKASVDGVFSLEKLEDYVLQSPDFNPQDCHSYNTECPYLRICTAPPEDRRALLDDYIVVPPDYAE